MAPRTLSPRNIQTPTENTGDLHRFEQVAALIEDRIRGLAPGEALPSTTAWRLKLGVSRTTITRAFALLKARGLVNARAGIGSRVDRPSRTRVVLVLWEGALGERNHGSLAGEFFTGAAMAASKRGDVLVTHLPAPQMTDDFRPRHEFPGIAGVLFFRCPALRKWLAPKLTAEGIPSVLYGSTAYADPVLDVAVDESEIGRLAMDALLAAGRERLGFLYRQGHPAGEARRQVWVDWHFAKGRTIDPTRVLAVPAGEWDPDPKILRTWLRKVDGVWAATDSQAVQLHDRCRHLGVRIPEDLALVGVDNSGYLAHLRPGISSIDIPLVDHAAKCLDALFAATPGMRLTDMTLIRRGSLPPAKDPKSGHARN